MDANLETPQQPSDSRPRIIIDKADKVVHLYCTPEMFALFDRMINSKGDFNLGEFGRIYLEMKKMFAQVETSQNEKNLKTGA